MSNYKIAIKQVDFMNFALYEEDNQLVRLDFVPKDFELVQVDKESGLQKEAFTQLEAYFAGRLKYFDLPLNPQGTDFMHKVWAELLKIPYAKTVSYKDIAQALGGKAYRAVGLANNKNPLPIFIPCHRVIGVNGKLVGYAGGLDLKKNLLDLEKKYAHI